MILAFNPQFEPRILSGRKIHTIREDKTNRWKPGNKIQMATGVRTKKYNCFKEAVCVAVQSIEITKNKVYIDGKKLNKQEIKTLAINDGFNGIVDFFKWFNQDFAGKIIHWTHFQYEIEAPKQTKVTKEEKAAFNFLFVAGLYVLTKIYYKRAEAEYFNTIKKT